MIALPNAKNDLDLAPAYSSLAAISNHCPMFVSLSTQQALGRVHPRRHMTTIFQPNQPPLQYVRCSFECSVMQTSQSAIGCGNCWHWGKTWLQDVHHIPNPIKGFSLARHTTFLWHCAERNSNVQLCYWNPSWVSIRISPLCLHPLFTNSLFCTQHYCKDGSVQGGGVQPHSPRWEKWRA